jgi:hypothetical protein
VYDNKYHILGEIVRDTTISLLCTSDDRNTLPFLVSCNFRIGYVITVMLLYATNEEIFEGRRVHIKGWI